MPSKVFISYRREDSRYPARRIYDAFAQSLPPDTVFMDIDSMAPGDDFVEVLEGWVQQCEVLLALIGPNWLKSIDPRTKRRRLDNPEDFVRIEVRGALARKIPVVPVLLDAAAMPTAAELPDDIKGLTRRNAEFIDFRTFDVDVQRLIKRLKIGSKVEPIARNPEPPAGDNGDRKVDTSGPAVPAATSEPDRLKVAPLRVWPAVGATLAVILAILLAARVIERWQPDVQDGQASAASDALKTSDAARREAEAGLAAALAAQAEAERASKTAEKRANDTADELKKSEKARLDAEARATSAAAAQAKAEEGQRAADKTRLTAEAMASGAAIARTKADTDRQTAEARVNDAVEALKKSEKARLEAEASASAATTARIQAETGLRDAETRLKQATDTLAKFEQARKNADVVNVDPQIKRQEPKGISALGPIMTRRRALLSDIGGKSRWAIGGTQNCNLVNDTRTVSLDVGVGSMTRTNGLGNVDVETILAEDPDMSSTITVSSNHISGTEPGQRWTYSRDSDRIHVQPHGRSAFVLTRCP